MDNDISLLQKKRKEKRLEVPIEDLDIIKSNNNTEDEAFTNIYIDAINSLPERLKKIEKILL